MATIKSQIAAVDDWDRAHGGDPRPEDWFIDEGWSGFQLERPGLEQLLEEARAPGRDWDELLIYDTSRLSREPFHRLYILEPELEALGIRVIYLASPIYEDNEDGELMEWMAAGMDRWFAKKARANMRRGLKDALKGGACWWAPYGYHVVRHAADGRGRTTYTIEVVPEEAAIVREVLERVLARETTTTIARDLNARSVPTRKGAPWSPAAIAAIIHDRYYVGIAGHGKKRSVEPQKRRHTTPRLRRRQKSSWVGQPEDQWTSKATVPALFTPEEQERAEAQLRRNQRVHARQTDRVYLLRGLLRCMLPQHGTSERCDRGLTASTKTNEKGREYPFYWCSRRYINAAPGEPRTCRNRLPGRATEELVWSTVIGALTATDDLHAALAKLQAGPEAQRQRWQEAIVRIATERDKLRERLHTQQRLLEEGIYSVTEYKEARSTVLPALEEAEQALAAAQKSLAAVRGTDIDWQSLERLCQEITRRAKAATPAVRAQILSQLLTSADVYADRLVICGVLGEMEVPLPRTPGVQLLAARRSR